MRIPPISTIPHQSVEDRKQLPHARHQGNLLRLARAQEPLVELLDVGLWRVATRALMYRTALNGALPPHASRLPLF